MPVARRELARLALACVLVCCSAAQVRAQPMMGVAQTDSVHVSAPRCALDWWDASALRAALEVELRSAGVSTVEVDQTASDPSAELPSAELPSAELSGAELPGAELRGAELSPTQLRMSLETEGDCEPTAALQASLLDGSGARASRRIELADVPSSSRTRALAMALFALFGAPREAPPLVEREPAPDRGAPRGRPTLLGDPGAAPRPVPIAAAPVTERASSPLVGVDLAGAFVYTPASSTPWGGPHAALRLYVASPLYLVVGADVLFTSASDALGEVRGTWLSGSLGVGAEAALAPLRVGGHASFGVGWARLEGIAGAPGIRADTSDDAVLSIDLALRAAWDLSESFALVLEADSRIIALGLEARSASGSVVSIRDATLGLRLGVELRF